MDRRMLQNIFHGILVDMAFIDRRYPETFPVFAKRKSGDWCLYGIEVPRSDLENTIKSIQTNMRADENFYSHLYNDDVVIVIFKTDVFRVTPHTSSWGEVLNYGRTLGIPVEQLDLWPNRFQDECHYF
jgi:hypothetical protein